MTDPLPLSCRPSGYPQVRSGRPFRAVLVLLCLILVAALVLPGSAVTLPDLTITDSVALVPDKAVFAGETNPVLISNVKNEGNTTASNVLVALYANDVSGGTTAVASTTISSLAAGAEQAVTLTDPTIRPVTANTVYGAGGVVSVTYTAKIDPANAISEFDETDNNLASDPKQVLYNGYKGKAYSYGGSDITTRHTYDLHGGLVHSFGDSVYKSGGFSAPWTVDTVSWSAANLPVPAGATVTAAWLYVPYTWDDSNEVNKYTLDFNSVRVTRNFLDRDASNYGTYATHFYGISVYDVTSLFQKNAANTAILTRSDSNAYFSPYGFTLAVVYTDSSASRKQIFLNEGMDILAASTTEYGTTPAEATASVPFTGQTVTPAQVKEATLTTFVPAGNGPEGDLLFGGSTIASSVWDYGSPTGTQVAVDSRNVKSLLQPTGNTAGIRASALSGTPLMAAAQQFLVVEYYRTPVANFAANTVSGTAPLSVTFTDQSTNNPTSWAWDFTNDGTTDSTAQNPTYSYTTAGTYSVKLTATNPAGSDDEIKTNYITVTSAGVIAFPGVSNIPKDLNSDGKYEDVNGNNRKDYGDVTVFYKNLNWAKTNEPISAFDFNGNGRIDFADVTVLYKSIAS